MQFEINRAPVLTLWATVVARVLGHSRATALSLGKAVSGIGAVRKAKSIGLIEDGEAAGPKPGARDTIMLLGFPVPVVEIDGEPRGLDRDRPCDPAAVEKYLRGKFGEHLQPTWNAMVALAKSRKPARLKVEAYGLYEKFRPAVPYGVEGWAKKGTLDLDKIAKLATA